MNTNPKDLTLANQLIDECLQSKSTYLELGNCGITDLHDLPKLFECTHLETLILSNKWRDTGIGRSMIRSKNEGTKNNIEFLSERIGELRRLKTLIAGGDPFDGSWSTKDLNYLQKLNRSNALTLDYNQIDSIDFLKGLDTLTTLDVSNNYITDIGNIASVGRLTDLKLNYNGITDIDPLKNLTRLTKLNISHNQITDISALEGLKDLRNINLSANKLTDISALDGLINLQVLNLSNNQITKIDALKDLTGLTNLNLRSNQITDVSVLEGLTRLTDIYLNNNQLTDINALEGLTNLRWLSLRCNQLTDISPLSSLTGLQVLNIDRNKIESIPEFIFRLENAEEIIKNNLTSNPVINPPIEIIEQGVDAVLRWFDTKELDNFNEIKIILIGDPEAGKTSLLKRLKSDDYKKGELQTDGINIVDIDFEQSDTFKQQTSLHGIKGRFWDFGGQEIMSATHRLFLSNRAVYILLLQARDDKANEKQVRDWMKQIISTGGDSPVLVVANKMDVNPSFDFVNQYAIKRDFGQIKDFVKISCETSDNLNQLKDSIAEIIPQSGFLKSKIDVKHIRLMEVIKQRTKEVNYLSEEAFIEICKGENVNITNSESRDDAIDFLDKVGIASYFDKTIDLDYYVLDPNWVTTGLYRILTSDLAGKQGGHIRRNSLKKVLNQEEDKCSNKYNSLSNKVFKYDSKGEISFMIEILYRYKLAFRLNDEEFIIPSLLPTNLDEKLLAQFEEVETLDFVYVYDSLPKNIISELLVEFYKSGGLTNYWRTGGLLEKPDTKALITASDNKISIAIISQSKLNRRDMMIYVRAVVEIVNKGLPKPPIRKIPLSGTNGDMVEYQLLLNRAEKDKKLYCYREDMDDEQKFDIAMLLDGIPSKSDLEVKIEKLEEKLDEGISKIDKTTTKTLENTEDIKEDTEAIKNQLKEHFEHLTSLLEYTSNQKEEIISAVQEINNEQQDGIYEDISVLMAKIFEVHNEDMDERLTEIYEQITKPSNLVSAKLELSIPLINLLGINAKVEFDFKQWSKTMYKKHKLKLFKLTGPI